MEQLTRVLAVYAGKFNIRVNAISPGLIVQDEYLDRFHDASNKDYKNSALSYLAINSVGRSDDVAHAALFLSSTLSSFITGHVLDVDGGGYIQDPFHLLQNHIKKD